MTVTLWGQVGEGRPCPVSRWREKPEVRRKVELNGGSIECLAVGSAHATNRADGLGRRARGGEIKLQFQNFSDTPLASHFYEHPGNAEIY